MGLGETELEKALYSQFFQGQSADTINKAIASGTLAPGSDKLLTQIYDSGTSINGVIYGSEDFNEFCTRRGLSYSEALNYLCAIAESPEKAPPIDKELATSMYNFLNVDNGQTHTEITKVLNSEVKKAIKSLKKHKTFYLKIICISILANKVFHCRFKYIGKFIIFTGNVICAASKLHIVIAG